LATIQDYYILLQNNLALKAVFPSIVEIVLTDVLLIDYRIENFEDSKMFSPNNK